MNIEYKYISTADDAAYQDVKKTFFVHMIVNCSPLKYEIDNDDKLY